VFEIIVTLAGAEIGGITLCFFGSLPSVERQIARHFFFLTDLPDLLHWAANDLHQLIAKGKAETHGNKQGQHHTCDDDTQVLEMLKKWLLLLLVRFITQLK